MNRHLPSLTRRRARVIATSLVLGATFLTGLSAAPTEQAQAAAPSDAAGVRELDLTSVSRTPNLLVHSVLFEGGGRRQCISLHGSPPFVIFRIPVGVYTVTSYGDSQCVATFRFRKSVGRLKAIGQYDAWNVSPDQGPVPVPN